LSTTYREIAHLSRKLLLSLPLGHVPILSNTRSRIQTKANSIGQQDSTEPRIPS